MKNTHGRVCRQLNLRASNLSKWRTGLTHLINQMDLFTESGSRLGSSLTKEKKAWFFMFFWTPKNFS